MRALKQGMDPNEAAEAAAAAIAEPPPTPESRADQVKAALRYLKDTASEMRRDGTTPRDIFEGSPEYFTGPSEVLRAIRIQWMSDILWQRRPIMPGYNWAMWKKLTGDLVERFQLKFNTKQRDPQDGTPRYGSDMFAVWCPEVIWQQQVDVFKRNSMGAPYETSEGAKEKLNEMTDGMAIGGVMRRTVVTRPRDAEEMGTIDVPTDLTEEAQRQRKEVGVPLQAEDR